MNRWVTKIPRRLAIAGTIPQMAAIPGTRRRFIIEKRLPQQERCSYDHFEMIGIDKPGNNSVYSITIEGATKNMYL